MLVIITYTMYLITISDIENSKEDFKKFLDERKKKKD